MVVLLDLPPLDLAAGTYSVVVEDGATLQSSPIDVVIATPATAIPNAPTGDTLLAYCSGSASILLEATPSGLPVFYTLNMFDSWGDGWNGNAITISSDGVVVLADATILSGDNGTATFASVEGATLTAEWTPGSFQGEVSFDILDQNGNVVYSAGYGGEINYTIPAGSYPLNWYDAASGGNLEGNGSPFESVGTGVMPAAETGIYDFFVTQSNEGCESSALQVTVEITDVNVTLSTTDETCTDYTNGGFAILDTLCGTEPFEFSVDGGAFGPAPNLTAGTYSIVVKDADSLFSAPISITINTLETSIPPSPAADSAVYACSGDASIELTAVGDIASTEFIINYDGRWEWFSRNYVCY